MTRTLWHPRTGRVLDVVLGLAGDGGDLLVIICQLLLDEGPGVVRLSLALGLELLEPILVGRLFHQTHRHRMGPPHLYGPADHHLVTAGAGQLAQGSDIDKLRRAH